MQVIEINEPGENRYAEDDTFIAVGIDFGTTNSLIAVSENGQVRVIKDLEGRQLIPTVIDINNEEGGSSLTKKISSIKRLVGKSTAEILNNPILLALCEGLLDPSSLVPRLKIGDTSQTMPELAAKIFIYLKQQAERDLGQPVKKAVVTVPAHFDDAAKAGVMLAAQIAGFQVLRLIAEPTAAAYAYKLNKKSEGCYLVYDLGGGTFDVSVLNMLSGVLQVIATGGDNMLGGDDIDHLLAEYLVEKHDSLESAQALKLAKEIKENVSPAQGVRSQPNITTEEFETLISPLIKRTIDITADTLERAGSPAIDGIILVGGSTRIPLITKSLIERFNVPILADIDPDKAVVCGAALQAENLTSKNNSLLIDVLPLSLGLELYGGLVEKIILRGSPLPLSVIKEFTTQADNQTGVQFHIVQGEREMANDCRSLARFELKSIPPMKAGAARIEVVFSVDADGLLSVCAMEKNSNRSQIIEIKPSYGLSGQEINQILEKAYQNAASDHNLRLLQEAILEARSLLLTTENAIKETPDILAKAQMDKIQRALAELQKTIQENDRALIIAASKNLEKLAEDLTAARLNASIGAKLKGKHISEV